MLPRHLRLTKSKEFSRIYKAGKHFSSPHLRIFYLPISFLDERTQSQNFSCFGFVVSKKQVSKIAARNRLKRVLRAEIGIRYRKILPRFAVVILAKPGITLSSVKAIRAELNELLSKAGLLDQKI